MGLRYVTAPDGGDHVTATARLCLTEARDRLVPDTDPDARWLWCAPGAQIRRADAQRYGLLDEPKPPAGPEGGERQEPPKTQRAASKAGRRPANKSRRPAANKSAMSGDGDADGTLE